MDKYENYIPSSFCNFAIMQSPFWFATAERGLSVLCPHFKLIEVTFKLIEVT